MSKVTVVDSPCGSGKTMWAIKMINQLERGTKVVFITPFLSECDRVIEKTKVVFYQPDRRRGKGKKSDDFITLISRGKNVVATHSLFSILDKNNLDILKKHKYILVIDESLNVVEGVSLYSNEQVGSEDKTMNDVSLLKDKGMIKEDRYGNLSWVDKKSFGRYEDLKNMIDSGNLFVEGNDYLTWTFSKDVFLGDYFEEIFVLTYRFDSQIQRGYFDYFSVNYTKKTIDKKRRLVDFFSGYDCEFRKNVRNLIEICESRKLNSVGDFWRDKCGRKIGTTLSVNWIKNNPNSLEVLRKNIQNYFKNITESQGGERMWTMFKVYKDSVMSQVCAEKNFVHTASRATNEYLNRKYLCYPINKYLNPNLIKFFARKDVSINQDEYALSEMIQWIWRSAIRNDEKIYIYIPSERMRNLLKNWLDIKE